MGMKAVDFFTPEEKEDIRQAIMNAELDTSGEIRVHIDNNCQEDVLDRAAFVFKQLKMHETHLRNGVLIYLALNNRRFAIIGDAGINSLVQDGYWDGIKHIMLNDFRDGRFCEGLVSAITSVGSQLKKHFPHQKNDVNELSDDLSFGDH
jgi:uncharacterized membrane protein